MAAENSQLKEENERLDQENLSVRDQLTGLTRSQPNYDQRWAETDGASGNRAQPIENLGVREELECPGASVRGPP